MSQRNDSEGLKVFIRVRPPIYQEVNLTNAVSVGGSSAVSVNSEKHDVSCSYDHVFNEISSQRDVFEKIEPLLVGVLSGVNACIFAYGQTSAGIEMA